MIDDLNPLYVYEAKMSLFTRMAQTRPGAERLLEAQILPILSQCEFLDARPEEDQSFMGAWRGVLACRLANVWCRPRFVFTLGDSAVPSAVYASVAARRRHARFSGYKAYDSK